jgi:hypothetical protein
LKADLYGNKIEYHGAVSGFGAGTGSAFSLLPAQNATGNWIKIVQRVPVRIALDPQELAAHPLQIGLSMQVEIDTHQRDAHGCHNSAVGGRLQHRRLRLRRCRRCATCQVDHRGERPARCESRNDGDGERCLAEPRRARRCDRCTSYRDRPPAATALKTPR